MPTATAVPELCCVTRKGGRASGVPDREGRLPKIYGQMHTPISATAGGSPQIQWSDPHPPASDAPGIAPHAQERRESQPKVM